MFGQVIIGPPGSGKTTYCNGMSQFMKAIGRKVAVVNLDPANDQVPYECAINIHDLISLSDVMEEFGLGPNGGLMYCVEYLEKNQDWLFEQMKEYKDHYLLFDCPGQVELYTHHDSMKNIVQELTKKNYRLASVHFVDSFYCSSPSNYISSVLLSLSTMLQLELPHVNVLSKIDLVEKYGKLDFNLEYYADVLDLKYIRKALKKENFSPKFAKLSKILCEVIEDFSLVAFATLNINDKDSVYKLLKTIDKSNGYIYGSLDKVDQMAQVATEDIDFDYFRSMAVQERYMEDEDDWEDVLVGDYENDNENGNEVDAMEVDREANKNLKMTDVD
jgi:GTPase SAR1 family protein